MKRALQAVLLALALLPSLLHADEALRQTFHDLQFIEPAEAAQLIREIHPRATVEPVEKRVRFTAPADQIEEIHVLLDKADLPPDQVVTQFLSLHNTDAEIVANGLNALQQGRWAVNILPDIRTNRIFLMGHPVFLIQLEAIIHQLDKPDPEV